jgi:hypothetical protein
MILAGHQPNYLPYLGFFHKLAACDLFVIVDNVQFVKRGPYGWIHRNRIRTHDGWMWLTVPVLTKGRYTQNIVDTYINSKVDWRHKHWRSMYLNYKKAPFFHKYSDFFYQLYNKDWEKIAELNETIILYIKEQLGIKAQVLRASEIGVQGKATDLIIDMCRKLDADEYLHGRHGKDYIDENKFSENKIECLYQDFQHPVYKQLSSPFMPFMSVVDLLFNEGDESLRILMN